MKRTDESMIFQVSANEESADSEKKIFQLGGTVAVLGVERSSSAYEGFNNSRSITNGTEE